MINYTGTIFRQSGSELDPNTCSIIVAAIQVVGVYTSSLLVDRVGRKALLLISSSGAAIALAMLGTFSYLHRQGVNVQAFDFIPLVSFSFYVFITCIGIMPLPFVILAEILPPKVQWDCINSFRNVLIEFSFFSTRFVKLVQLFVWCRLVCLLSFHCKHFRCWSTIMDCMWRWAYAVASVCWAYCLLCSFWRKQKEKTLIRLRRNRRSVF